MKLIFAIFLIAPIFAEVLQDRYLLIELEKSDQQPKISGKYESIFIKSRGIEIIFCTKL